MEHALLAKALYFMYAACVSSPLCKVISVSTNCGIFSLKPVAEQLNSFDIALLACARA